MTRRLLAPILAVALLAAGAVAPAVAVPAEAFSPTEGGKARDSEVSRLNGNDLEVAVVIDTSGSMGTEPMAAAKAAAIDFIDALPPSVRVSVIGFAAEAAVVAGLDDDRDTVKAAVEGLQSGGGTALYDAIGAALAQLPEKEGTRRVIVLLSDGGDTESAATLQETAQALAASGVTLHAIELLTSEPNGEALALLTDAGGGTLVGTENPAALAALYDDVASKILKSRPVEPGLLDSSAMLAVGAAALFVAFTVFLLVLFAPRQRRTRLARREGGRSGTRHTTLSGVADRATMFADRALDSHNKASTLNAALERAGIALRPGEYIVLASCAVVTAVVVGLLLAGWFLAILLAIVTGLGFRLALSFLAGRRQSAFAEQLGDTLQLLAGSLRAGYGIMQAIDAVAKEAESPTRDEFRRLVVETRLGRDLDGSLRALADRLSSEDFAWVVQAIEIHREVGGDLAEVLDTVAGTIRERDQIRRQVKALSAEGRLSAIILLILPFVVGGMVLLTNPSYLTELHTEPVGWVMLGVGAVLMVTGALWLKRIVRLVF